MFQSKWMSRVLMASLLGACWVPLACDKTEEAGAEETTQQPVEEKTETVAAKASAGNSAADSETEQAEAEEPAAAGSAAAEDSDEEAEDEAAKAALAAADEGKPSGDKPSSDKEPAKDSAEEKKEAKPEPTGYTGDKPCRAKTFKFSSVRKACETGGVPKAKSMMKSLVKRAKDKGEKMKCSSCHDNTKTYTLKPNAVSDMKKIL